MSTLTAEQLNQRAKAQEIEYLRRRGLDANGKPLKGDGEDDENGQDDEIDPAEGDDDDPEDGHDDSADSDPQDDEDDYADEATEEDDDADPDEDEPEQRNPKNTKNKGKDTFDYKAEYNRLKQENNALRGRVPLAQSQVASLQQRNEANEARIQQLTQELAQLQSKKSAADIADSIRESLTEDEFASIGEDGLAVMTKVVQTAMKAQVPAIDPRKEVEQILRERDSQSLTEFKHGLIKEDPRLSRIGALLDDAEFNAWLEENPEVDSGLRDLSSQQDRTKAVKLVKRLSIRLADFFGEEVEPEQTGSKKTVKDPKAAKSQKVPNPSGSKAGLMRRRPEAALTTSQVDALSKEAQRLARSRRPEDVARYDEIMKKLDSITQR